MSIPISLGMKKIKRNTSGAVFAANLKSILKERGLTAKAVAKGSKISPSTLGQWINGAAPLDLLAVYRLASFLNVDFTWLLTGKENPANTPELKDLFNITDASDLEGIFLIQAKRLQPKKGTAL